VRKQQRSYFDGGLEQIFTGLSTVRLRSGENKINYFAVEVR
jgi:hypothetical protein